MLAVDTNIVVRYLTRDHSEQAARTKQLIDDNDVLVVTTVLLEVDWVLRSQYGFSRSEAVAALRAFSGLPRVIVENVTLLAQALDWAEGGMDFADALHLAGAKDCEAFVSFDRRLAAAARRIGTMPVRAP